MLRDEIRAVERLRVTKANAGNSFWQSIIMVTIGAAISFISTLANNFYSSRNENKKVALEQKVLFEKDVAACFSSDLTSLEQLSAFGNGRIFKYLSSRWGGGSGDTQSDDTAFNIFIKNSRVQQSHSLAIELLMSSYVDSMICIRFHTIDSTLLFILQAQIQEYQRGMNSQPLDSIWAHDKSFDDQRLEMVPKIESFMREFHSSIIR